MLSFCRRNYEEWEWDAGKIILGDHCSYNYNWELLTVITYKIRLIEVDLSR